MEPGALAAATPDKAAYVLARSGETVTFRTLDDESNRLAQVLWQRGRTTGGPVLHGGEQPTEGGRAGVHPERLRGQGVRLVPRAASRGGRGAARDPARRDPAHGGRHRRRLRALRGRGRRRPRRAPRRGGRGP